MWQGLISLAICLGAAIGIPILIIWWCKKKEQPPTIPSENGKWSSCKPIEPYR